MTLYRKKTWTYFFFLFYLKNSKSEKRNKEIAERLVEKHVEEHIYRRLSAGGHSESEKVFQIKFY